MSDVKSTLDKTEGRGELKLKNYRIKVKVGIKDMCSEKGKIVNF